MHTTDPKQCGQKYLDFYTRINGLKSAKFQPISIFMLLSNYYNIENLGGLENLINKAEIKVTTKDIKQYLAEQAKNDIFMPSVNLSSRFLRKNDRVSVTQAHPSKCSQSILAATQKTKSKQKSFYHFDGVAKAYYRHNVTYIKNTKVRATKLLNIAMYIAIGRADLIEQDLKELDIQLDESGNVLNADLKRLLLPLVWNLDALHEKVAEANNLENYVGRSNNIPMFDPANTKETQGDNHVISNFLFFVPWSPNQLENYQMSVSSSKQSIESSNLPEGPSLKISCFMQLFLLN